MYIDLIVLGVSIVFVGIYSKRFQTYIFGFGMIDILFRILNIIKDFIPVKDIKSAINTYIPQAVPDVINKYTDGVLSSVLIWIYVVVMAMFLYLIVKVFIKRKKI